MPPLSATARTIPGRKRDRAQADRAALYDVLDTGRICHLGLVVDGSPRVLPTCYGRIGDVLYVHGSTGAHSLTARGEVCVAVTHLDGLVLARSVMHHSVNYRSAVIYAMPRTVTDPDEKRAALRAIVELLTPGQWDAARPPTRKELAATTVVVVSLAEASVKVRQGPPGDETADHELNLWAGVLPVRQVLGEPVPDPLLRPGIPVPDHVHAMR